MYLLDSISKNVGSPYTTLFGLNLYKVFTQAYSLVPDGIRQKMYELFQTWKQTASGSMLFASEPMKKIDNFLINARSKQAEIQAQDQKRKQTELQQHAQKFMANGPLPQSALLTEVDKLLDLTNQRKSMDPNDTDAQKQFTILTQLKDVLSKSTLPAEMLPTIQQQLVTFNQKEAARLNDRVHTPTPPPAGATAQAPFPQQQQFPPQGFPAGMDLSKLPFFNQQQQQPMPPFNNMPQQPVIPPSLFNSLQSAGLLNMNSNNGGIDSGRGNTPQPPPQINIQVELSNASLQTPRKELIDKLYKQLPKQCGTCGKRFSNDEDGKKQREAHLDWHFRVNKKLREENRSNHRCWYLTEEEWVEYKDEIEILGMYSDDDANNNNNGGSNNTHNGTTNNGSEKKDSEKSKKKINYEEEEAKYVPVPSDKKLAGQPCPICQEKFQSVWNDQVEDWVWKNAIDVEGVRIFHATCYAENESAGNKLIKRIVDKEKQQSQPPKKKENINQLLGNMNLADILANANKRKRVDDNDDDDNNATVKKEKVDGSN